MVMVRRGQGTYLVVGAALVLDVVGAALVEEVVGTVDDELDVVLEVVLEVVDEVELVLELVLEVVDVDDCRGRKNGPKCGGVSFRAHGYNDEATRRPMRPERGWWPMLASTWPCLL